MWKIHQLMEAGVAADDTGVPQDEWSYSVYEVVIAYSLRLTFLKGNLLYVVKKC